MKPENEQEQQRIIAGLKQVDNEFTERALALVRQYHVTNLLDVPRELRAELFKWRTEQYRKVYGMDPKWGDPTPESRRETRRARRRRLNGDNGSTEPQAKLAPDERKARRRARRQELRELRKATKNQ